MICLASVFPILELTTHCCLHCLNYTPISKNFDCSAHYCPSPPTTSAYHLNTHLTALTKFTHTSPFIHFIFKVVPFLYLFQVCLDEFHSIWNRPGLILYWTATTADFLHTESWIIARCSCAFLCLTSSNRILSVTAYSHLHFTQLWKRSLLLFEKRMTPCHFISLGLSGTSKLHNISVCFFCTGQCLFLVFEPFIKTHLIRLVLLCL